MAAIYVKSGAGGAGTGADWTNAFTTLAAAIAVWTTADTIYVSNNHAETATTTNTISKTSSGVPVPIYCVSDAAIPPTTLATTAVVGANTTMTVDGDLDLYGITFRSGVGGTSVAQNVFCLASGKPRAEQCHFEIAGGASSTLNFGTTNSGSIRAIATYINCTLKTINTSNVIVWGRNRTLWIGGGFDAASTIPTNVFTDAALCGGTHTFMGFDLSPTMVVGKTIFGGGTPVSSNVYKLVDCKLGSAGTFYTAPSDQALLRVIVSVSDSANTNYNSFVRDPAGTIDVNTAQYITAGSSAGTDGTTGYSLKFTGNANSVKMGQPLCSEWMGVWNDVTGVSQTITVETLVDAAAGMNDDEIWIEGIALTDSGSSLGAFFSDRRPLMTAASAQTTGIGIGSWTKGSASTGWISQKLTASFTAQKKGVVYYRICYARNATCYVNERATIA